MSRFVRTGFVALVLLLAACVGAYAQTGANVAVVINEASAASIEIGEYYAQKRNIPASNVIRLSTSVEESLTRAAYRASIESPLAKALFDRGIQDRVLYIVLTKGVPLKISGAPGVRGDAASVDSELTLLYRRMTGRDVLVTGTVDNPYHAGAKRVGEARPFSRRDHDIYLVTRLDGFTVEEVRALVDRGLAPARDGRILLDRRKGMAAGPADLWLVEAATTLRELGHGDRVDLVEELPAEEGGPAILGYYSWGSNDPGNRKRRLGLRFTAGSIAATLAGPDARTFAAPPEGWEPAGDLKDRKRIFAQAPQSLTADLISDGVTGAGGNISEPLLGSSIRPQILFPAYLSGFNLAEAFYLALPHLSWQSVIVGDPLCRPFAGRTLTPAEIEAPVEAVTALPGFFAARRMDTVRARSAGAPPEAVALIVKAETLMAAGDTAGARGVLEQVTTLAPGHVEARMQLASLYELASNVNGAVEQYRRVIDLQPRNATALNNLAYRLAIDQKNPSEALPLATRAATLVPADPRIMDTLGWIHHLLGNHAEAVRLLAEAARRTPASADIRLHAAHALAAVGSYAAAEAHLQEAVRLSPAIEARPDVQALRATLSKRR